MHDRRRTYFVFQGLLAIVLLLFFYYARAEVDSWALKLAFLTGAFAVSLAAVKRVSAERLSGLPAQAGLFLLDALLASLALLWTQEARSELYLTYFLIIFGTALTKSLRQSFVIALVASGAYLAAAWDPGLGAEQEPGFWLRLVCLWVTASFTATLSLDSREEGQALAATHARELRHMEQLAAMGRLSGEVAHGIKGPLTTILVNADILLQRHGRLPGVAAELRQIQDEVGRCREVLQSLLELGRIEDMGYDAFDLRDPVRSALEKMAARFERRRVLVATAGLDAPAPALGDPSLIFEAVYELLQNAEQASKAGGRVSVSVRSVSKKAWWAADAGDRREYLEVEIGDDGAGMDPATLQRVFDPFFTTKGEHGSGLGLSAALRILHKHSGTIEAASDGPGRGSRFTLTIPGFKKALPAS